MAFVFFDAETTGLQAGFDQIVHFAAIKVDNDLCEVERFEVRSRLNPNIVPHPSALKTNSLPIEQLLSEELHSHYQMMRQLNSKLLSWSPSVFLGYNSLRFDEEMLRHALFQTLHPAYLTSCHGNGRNDVFSLALAAYAIGQDALIVPEREDGAPVFRLEELSTANGIRTAKAHDAMSDAETTLALCKLVKLRSPDLWQRFIRFSNKAAVSEFVASEEGFLLTEYFANQAYHTPVVYIGEEPDLPNGRLCFDLSYNYEKIASLTADELQTALSNRPSPLRKFRTNAGPTVTPLWEAPKDLLGATNIDELEERANRFSEDEALKNRIIEAYSRSRNQYPEPTHIEEMLYARFPSSDDEARLRQFHEVSWYDKFKVVQTVEDDRLREFGIRVLYFEARSCLPGEIVNRLDRETAERLICPDGKPMSLVRCLIEIDKLEAANTNDQQTFRLLNGFREYVINRSSRVSSYLETENIRKLTDSN